MGTVVTTRTARWGGLPVWPLIWATAANYVWQVPYALHQYGWSGLRLAGLSLPLLVTGAWFGLAVRRHARSLRGGTAAVAAFLVVEVAFYAVHNATGALGADLPLSNPVVLIASVLGYVNTVLAIVYLVALPLSRRARAR